MNYNDSLSKVDPRAASRNNAIQAMVVRCAFKSDGSVAMLAIQNKLGEVLAIRYKELERRVKENKIVMVPQKFSCKGKYVDSRGLVVGYCLVDDKGGQTVLKHKDMVDALMLPWAAVDNLKVSTDGRVFVTGNVPVARVKQQ